MTRFVAMIGLLLAGILAFGTAYAASGKLVIYTSQPNKDAQQTVRVISRYGARPKSTAGTASIGLDQADWYRSWSAQDAVRVPIRVF